MFATLKSWLKPTPTAARPQPKLALTALEAREVPAFLASWSPQDLVLRLTGTNGDDTATVLQANGVVQVVGAGAIQVKVNGQVVGAAGALPSTQIVKVVADGYDRDDTVSVVTIPFNDSRDYSLHRPLALEAYGGRGNDTLKGDNFYVVKDTLDGGSGDDRLEGNGGDDTLTGGADIDTLVGGMGNDTLDGGTGNDWLFGDSGTSMHPDTYRALNTTAAKKGGNDTLRGGDGNDYLWGEGGNDTLYGQGGNDRLYGGWGNDGLFGGSHYDVLEGEGGADRLLVWEPVLSDLAYTTLNGVQTEDAVVRFRDGKAGTYKNTVHTAGSWNPADIETMDGALRWLHERTGNTKLLERATGSDLVFVRLGGRNGQATAWNAGGAELIYCPDNMLSLTPARVQAVTVHEIGHNWDTENPKWTQFMAISGWTQTPQSGSEWCKGGDDDENWWYKCNAEFVSGYAKTNPREDFAECLEAIFEGNTDAIPMKTALINSWLDSISS